jgi:hypothetical protein
MLKPINGHMATMMGSAVKINWNKFARALKSEQNRRDAFYFALRGFIVNIIWNKLARASNLTLKTPLTGLQAQL